ncbi:MAG: hypothetical protein IKA96_00630 [Alistipes sp.]|nr:hypothetical protein [Alistipes sp.]
MTRKVNILHLVVALAVGLCCVGCFKSTVGYTIFRTAVFIQSTDKGDYVKARDLYTYAYYVDTTDWKVASYEDACNKIITNKLTGERREMPDVYGEMNPSNEYQLTMVINRPMTMMILVDPENKVYAYRNYELPDNLPQVDTKLYIVSWRNSYTTAGWRIVNEFYKPPQPETDPEPAPDDEPETDPEPAPDDEPETDPENPDEPNTTPDDGEGEGADDGADNSEGGSNGEGEGNNGEGGSNGEGEGNNDENGENDGEGDSATDTPSTDTPATDDNPSTDKE